MRITINDIDGNQYECTAHGTQSEVMAEYHKDHPVQRLITRAIDHGTAEDTYEIDGEEFTTRVFVDYNENESK